MGDVGDTQSVHLISPQHPHQQPTTQQEGRKTTSSHQRHGRFGELARMKFVELRTFDLVNQALIFEASDCRVVGGAELYTTKAAGLDKKLYKQLDQHLTSRYHDDAALCTSLSPDSRPGTSPFGPLDQTANRRAFAYMIATLNAANPDHDFSSLRPDDFSRERSLKETMNRFNSTLQSMGRIIPRLWDVIDTQLDLRDCDIYAYQGDESPWGDEPLIWSQIYFFFNKKRKRVCYVHLRGLSRITSPKLGGGEEEADEDEEYAEFLEDMEV